MYSKSQLIRTGSAFLFDFLSSFAIRYMMDGAARFATSEMKLSASKRKLNLVKHNYLKGIIIF